MSNNLCRRWVGIFRAATTLAVLALLTVESLGVERQRVYTLGEDDPGAMVGQPLVGLATNDTQPSPADSGGSLAPMTASAADNSPLYVSVSDRPGAAAGALGIAYDGVDDQLVGPAYDPRNFNGSFSALSQAWVKPAALGSEQFIWRVGTDNGGVGISADGFYEIIYLENNIVVGNIAAEIGEWAHLTLWRTGNDGTLFVNGRVAARTTGFWNVSGPEVVLGSDLSDIFGVERPYQGAVDNFNIASSGAFNVTTDIDFFADSGITFSGVAGDINQDGQVNQQDYLIWAENVGLDNGFGIGDPGTLLLGDADQSGQIDLRDFQIINQGALAAGSSLSTSVPEPASLVVLLSGLALMASGRGGRRKRVPAHVILVGAAAIGLAGACAGTATAEVVVADDFFYNGPTKVLGVGGGFNGFQQYLGGQNGPAGNWDPTGLWGQIGDGIITTTTFEPPEQRNLALFSGFFAVQDELFRDFSLAGTVSPTQTLFFGGQFRAQLGDVPQFYAPRLFLNRVAGNDNVERDRTQDIAVGFSDNSVVARLGDGAEAMTAATGAPPNDGQWHTVIGKLELNASGTNERLTVWLDPTGVETGGTTAQVEANVLTDLNALIGTLHMQGSVPGAPTPLGRSFIDDVAIGTAWNSVAEVDVPRLTLRIDPMTGGARIVNTSSVALELNSYSIESEDGSLNPAGWNSLDNQDVGNWLENLATADQLVETSFEGSTTVSPGGQLSLGNLFTANAMQDVTARFGTLDGLVNLLPVEYGPDVSLEGDFNGDGKVDAADYVVWRKTDGSQPGYVAWRANFGRTAGASAAASAAVPEPGMVGLILLAAFGAVQLGHWKRADRTYRSGL
ncbi:MAG TPA: LamG-like jellyroll fold domain-containing protein [Lacipirellulaceae bacterium]